MLVRSNESRRVPSAIFRRAAGYHPATCHSATSRVRPDPSKAPGGTDGGDKTGSDRWVIEDVVAPRCLTLLVGKGGLGKSYLALMQEDANPEQAVRRVLVCDKNRLAAEPKPIWLRIAAEGEAMVVDRCQPFDGAGQGQRPVRDMLIEQVRLTVLTAGGPIRRAEIARRLDRNPKDRSVGRCLAELERDGRIRRLAIRSYVPVVDPQTV